MSEVVAQDVMMQAHTYGFANAGELLILGACKLRFIL